MYVKLKTLGIMKRTKISMKRKNFKKPQSIILAKAVPNPKYKHLQCIQDVALIALFSGKKVSFAQIDKKGQRSVSTRFIRWLFENDQEGKRITDRPWRRANNPEFYAVLNRHKKKYNPIFKKLTIHEIKKSWNVQSKI